MIDSGVSLSMEVSMALLEEDFPEDASVTVLKGIYREGLLRDQKRATLPNNNGTGRTRTAPEIERIIGAM